MILNSKNKNPYVIAEAGVNHNGNYNLAKKLIKEASICKADAVKFQIFDASVLTTNNTPLAFYQKKNLKRNISQLKMLKNLELSSENFIKLKNYAKKLNIDFLVSIFDEKSLKFAEKELKCRTIKIPSGEITNFFLLKDLNLKRYNIILSTGMSNLKEIAESLNVISRNKVFSITKNKIKILNKTKHSFLKKKIFLLHCISDYPAEKKYLNLNSIKTLFEGFQLPVGFSDHSKGSLASCLAVAKGALVIEKHFTLNKKMIGPDHSSSLYPSEFKEFVNDINDTVLMLGKFEKKIQNCEKKNIKVVRKSIIALKSIKKDELFSFKNLNAKRFKEGISPMDVNKFINKKAKRNYKKDEVIKKQ